MAFHEVSANRILWTPAVEEFPDLFGGKFAEAVAEAAPIQAKPAGEIQWFYLDKSRNQVGPVPETELRELIRNGQIKANVKVWTSGMPAWESANSTITGLDEISATTQTPKAHKSESRDDGKRLDPALTHRAMKGLVLLGIGLCLTPFYPFFAIFGLVILMGLGQPIRSPAQTALILLGMAVSFMMVTLFGYITCLMFTDGQYTNWIGLGGAAISSAFYLLHFHSLTHTVSKLAQIASSPLWAQIAAVLQLILVLADMCIAGAYGILLLSSADSPAYLYGGLGSVGIFFFLIVLIGLVIAVFSVRQALPHSSEDRISMG